MTSGESTQTTVFLSYRREGGWQSAQLVTKAMEDAGHDVFLDTSDLGSGAFPQRLKEEIAARRHFVVVISKGSLQRVHRPDDWLRTEIRTALDHGCIIVPLLFDGMQFAGEEFGAAAKIPEIAEIEQYNAISVHPDYFDSAMNKLLGFLRGKTPASDTSRSEPPFDRTARSRSAKTALVAVAALVPAIVLVTTWGWWHPVPIVAVNEPAFATTVRGATVVIAGTASADSSCEVRVGAARATVDGETWRATVPIKEGMQEISINAMDEQGRSTTIQHKVFGALTPDRFKTELVSHREAQADAFITSLRGQGQDRRRFLDVLLSLSQAGSGTPLERLTNAVHTQLESTRAQTNVDGLFKGQPLSPNPNKTLYGWVESFEDLPLRRVAADSWVKPTWLCAFDGVLEATSMTSVRQALAASPPDRDQIGQDLTKVLPTIFATIIRKHIDAPLIECYEEWFTKGTPHVRPSKAAKRAPGDLLKADEFAAVHLFAIRQIDGPALNDYQVMARLGSIVADRNEHLVFRTAAAHALGRAERLPRHAAAGMVEGLLSPEPKVVGAVARALGESKNRGDLATAIVRSVASRIIENLERSREASDRIETAKVYGLIAEIDEANQNVRRLLDVLVMPLLMDVPSGRRASEDLRTHYDAWDRRHAEKLRDFEKTHNRLPESNDRFDHWTTQPGFPSSAATEFRDLSQGG